MCGNWKRESDGCAQREKSNVWCWGEDVLGCLGGLESRQKNKWENVNGERLGKGRRAFKKRAALCDVSFLLFKV